LKKKLNRLLPRFFSLLSPQASPTCIRELDTQFNLNIAGVLFDAIEQKIKPQK
jgi:hypothetical protein